MTQDAHERLERFIANAENGEVEDPPFDDLRTVLDRLSVMEEALRKGEVEAERWCRAYRIAHDQAMSNGAALAEARARLAKLEQD